MANGLPVDIQNKIMLLAGADSAPTPARAKARPPPPKPATPPAIPLPPTARPLLTPADRFGLLGEGGPGFCVLRGLLGAAAPAAARAAATLRDGDRLQPAAMGRGLSQWTDRGSRGDAITWLHADDDDLPRPLHELMRLLAGLRRELSDALECLEVDAPSAPRVSGGVSALGKLNGRVSTQLAAYPGEGEGYARHFDCFAGSAKTGDAAGVRRFTAIWYANESWEPAHGGALRLYVPRAWSRSGHFDLEPRLDTVVVFRSELVEHEVMAVHSPRLAITQWWYGQPARGTTASGVNATHSPGLDATAAPRPPPRARARAAPGPPALPLAKDARAARARIFVSIASYRDSECLPTIRALFENAAFSERIFVGVVSQHETREGVDGPLFAAEHALDARDAARVRWDVIDWREAAGPCVARARAQQLWRGEEYVLQIDSHMRCRKNWDDFLISTLARCPPAAGLPTRDDGHSMAILTAYPVGYKLPNEVPNECRATLLCPGHFDQKDGLLRSRGRLLAKARRDRARAGAPFARLFEAPPPNQVEEAPLRSPLWCAGFSFGSCQMLLQAPYDDIESASSWRYPFLFFGEELQMAARLYTRGFDFFAPPCSVFYHLWDRGHRPSFRQIANPSRERLEKESLARVKALLQIGAQNPAANAAAEPPTVGTTHGLGTYRTIEQYEALLGVDLNAQKISPGAENAGHDPSIFNDSSGPGAGLLALALQMAAS